MKARWLLFFLGGLCIACLGDNSNNEIATTDQSSFTSHTTGPPTTEVTCSTTIYHPPPDTTEDYTTSSVPFESTDSWTEAPSADTDQSSFTSHKADPTSTERTPYTTIYDPPTNTTEDGMTSSVSFSGTDSWTESASVPGSPQNVSAEPLSLTSVQVSWEPPIYTNAEIENYMVLIEKPNLFTCYYPGNGSGSCTLYNLQKGTEYRVMVFACNRAACSDPSPHTFSTWTGELAPSIVSKMNPTGHETDTTQIQLQLPLNNIPMNVTGPLRAVTLVVHTITSESSKTSEPNNNAESTTRRRRSADEPFRPLLETYADKSNGSWEVIVREGTNVTNLSNLQFTLGNGSGHPKSSHYYNGPLDPETTYSVEMRMYFLANASTTPAFTFRTADKPWVPLVILGIVFGLMVLFFFVILGWRCSRHNARELPIEEDEYKKTPDTQSVFITYFQPDSLPYYNQHTVAPIKIEDFSNYIDHLFRPPNDNIGLQFQLLNIFASQQADYYRLTTQLGELFVAQNRSFRHPPYDQSLVFLDRTWSEDNLPHRSVIADVDNYIDASYVAGCTYHPENGTALIAAYNTPPAFIVAASPNRSTHTKFLKMVTQQRSPFIIHLGGKSALLNDSGENYWPDEVFGLFTTYEDAYEVTLSKEFRQPYWINRSLTITPRCKGKQAEVWHIDQLHCTAWPAKNPPRMAVFYDFLQVYLSMLPTDKKTAPTIIHSSAEDGREGTFICAILLLQQLRTHADVIDVFGTVLALRKCRSDLVITKEQLEFLYKFVGYCITREKIFQAWHLVPSTSISTLGAVIV